MQWVRFCIDDVDTPKIRRSRARSAFSASSMVFFLKSPSLVYHLRWAMTGPTQPAAPGEPSQSGRRPSHGSDVRTDDVLNRIV
jgi:hypothetical protein